MATKKKMLQAAAGVSTGPEGAWDLSYAYYDDPLGWDLSTAVYSGKSFSIAGQEVTPAGLFFKPDGTKMYVTGSNGDDVNEYNLSTAWDVSTATFLQLFSVSAQDTSPADIFFKPDGTKMYVMGFTGDEINEYDLSTAWDVSTATFVQVISVVGQESQPQGLFFKPDGTKMYVIGASGDDVNEYDLSTAWDISTASFLQLFSVSAQEASPQGLSFKGDGTKMYVIGFSSDNVHEYNLSTAWDVSTASFVQNFSIAAQETGPTSMFFRPDGLGFYVLGSVNDTVYQYALGGFDVSAQETATEGVVFKPDGTKMYIIGTGGDEVNEYDIGAKSFSVAAEESSPTGVFFKPDGTKMYITGSTGDEVNEYDLSVAWEVTTSVFSQSFSVSAQEAAPQDLFFKPDGTKMYITGSSGDDINEYNLSTAWDISTAVFNQLFSVAAQDTAPFAISFKPDGTKMYFSGAAGLDVNEFDLSSAWDISTASYLQNFSVSAQDTSPGGLFFKPDGTKMYMLGATGDDVNEYDLSTAWDVSTAAFVQNSSISGDITNGGLFFKPDGTEFFIVDQDSDSVRTYALTTAWDVSSADVAYDPDLAWDTSTATFVQSFSVAAQETFPQDVTFKPDGTKMYITGANGVDVNEYNLSTAWNISTASFLQSFSVSDVEGSPQGAFFKPDGTKMYVAGSGGDKIYEYDLSTEWDVSTASLLQSLTVSPTARLPSNVFFKPDGTKMFISDDQYNNVLEYDISTAWDVSSALYSQAFSVSGQESSVKGLFFHPDGTQFFIVGTAADRVFTYTLGPQD